MSITHLEHDHVVLGEARADVALYDHVGPGALEAARGRETEVVV